MTAFTLTPPLYHQWGTWDLGYGVAAAKARLDLPAVSLWNFFDGYSHSDCSDLCQRTRLHIRALPSTTLSPFIMVVAYTIERK